MRLNVDCQTNDIQETKEFADWILKVGEGKVGGPNDGEVVIQIPHDLLIDSFRDPIGGIVKFVYPCILSSLSNPTYFQERDILASTHEFVDEINSYMLSKVDTEERVYLSSDRVCESEDVNSHVVEALYPPDVINGLKLAGLPNHKLTLKLNVPIMLLRNIDQQQGLCNGTRLRVTKLGDRIIEAVIITGNNIGMRTLIHRMRMSVVDKRIPFRIQRWQFPIAICFALTINKSQGQSLLRVGLYLPRLVFTHGQLYVALSRVKSKKGLKVLIVDKKGVIGDKTTNVVYKEALRNV